MKNVTYLHFFQTKLYTIESVALHATHERPSSGSLPLFFAKGKSFYHLCNPTLKSLHKTVIIKKKNLNLTLFYPICMSLHWHAAKVYTLLEKT